MLESLKERELDVVRLEWKMWMVGLSVGLMRELRMLW